MFPLPRYDRVIARCQQSHVVADAVRVPGFSVANEENVLQSVVQVPPSPGHFVRDKDESHMSELRSNHEERKK